MRIDGVTRLGWAALWGVLHGIAFVFLVPAYWLGRGAAAAHARAKGAVPVDAAAAAAPTAVVRFPRRRDGRR